MRALPGTIALSCVFSHCSVAAEPAAPRNPHVDPMPITPLRDDALASLEQTTRPTLVFKHSPSCGRSADARLEIVQLAANDAALPIFEVNVLSQRPLSRAIEARFGVVHESPQALLLQNGRVLWHASHGAVTVRAVRAALREAPLDQGTAPTG